MDKDSDQGVGLIVTCVAKQFKLSAYQQILCGLILNINSYCHFLSLFPR